MPNLEFQLVKNAALAPGMVLRVGETDSKYLRLTHVFEDCAYVMWVSTPENARYARRPKKMLLGELKQLASATTSTWGRFVLPLALSTPPLEGSERFLAMNAAWLIIQPLVAAFEKEANLSRTKFTSLVRERAEAMQASFITLHRMIIRYYYFGGTRFALLSLPPGISPGDGRYADVSTENSNIHRPPKRRGRKSILTDELGANDFIALEDDIKDMVDCLKKCLRKGPTYLTSAHEDYLSEFFKKRHPDIHAKYLTGKIMEPITVRQYRYYIYENARLDEELAKNMRTQDREQGYLGSVRAAGPAEVYEIDATGGRLHLVSTDDPPVLLGKPTIYFLIDRWSRFVVSAYLSLRSPSYEEVRHVLLVAFTSREKRFSALGVDIDDVRWPIGRMPAVLCPDRGSDFMSESMEQAVVHDLRIEMTPLPPFCPDGKAIVERLIREVKRRMASSKMKGVYADRPLDPHSKRAARKAEAAAVHSLSEAYRFLIEIIDDHNNRPHSTLKRRRVLTQAGVQPTPKNAYLWGLEHITGLRTAPLTDKDYHRLLLSVDTASISNGILRYKGRPYKPFNEAAIDLAAKSTTRAKAKDVRVDKTFPHEIFIPHSRGEWASFKITQGGASELHGMSLDEEVVQKTQTGRLWARAEHQSRVKRVAAKSTKTKTSSKRIEPAVKVDKLQQLKAREQATTDMKRKLTGDNQHDETNTIEQSQSEESWMQIEKAERLRNLELVRQQRRKR
jgi:hypothetical protein